MKNIPNINSIPRSKADINNTKYISTNVVIDPYSKIQNIITPPIINIDGINNNIEGSIYKTKTKT